MDFTFKNKQYLRLNHYHIAKIILQEEMIPVGTVPVASFTVDLFNFFVYDIFHKVSYIRYNLINKENQNAFIFFFR